MVGRMVIGLLALFLVSCADPREWEPAGQITWIQWKEVDNAGTRVGQATYLVKNTGRVDLTSLGLALELKTDADVYYKQFQTTVDLPPGSSSYQTIEWPYHTATETASLAALRVESATFR